ncbi:unnamed protein product, partial [Prorocentrum cordatum]
APRPPPAAAGSPEERGAPVPPPGAMNATADALAAIIDSHNASRGVTGGRRVSLVARVLDFRVDVDEELQSWILFFATVSALWLFCLPFFCEGLSFQSARSCAVCMKQNLPLFFFVVCLLDACGLALLIGWLPAWTVSEY